MSARFHFSLSTVQHLTGIIGFSTIATGTSGLDVADAPGITTSLALAIDAAAVPSALLLWQRVERRASTLLLADLAGGLTLAAGRTLPLPVPRAGTVAPPAGFAAGVIIDWSALPAPQVLTLASLAATLSTADPVGSVVVVDLLDGQVLQAQAVNLPAGAVSAPLHLAVVPRYGGPQRTFVGLATTSALRQTNSTLRPAYLDLADTTSAPTSADGALVTPVGVIGCNLTAWVLQYADRFAAALWHLSAAELLSEKLNSPRTNWLTLHDPAQAVALRDALRGAYEALRDALITHPPGGGPCAACTASGAMMGGMLP